VGGVLDDLLAFDRRRSSLTQGAALVATSNFDWDIVLEALGFDVRARNELVERLRASVTQLLSGESLPSETRTGITELRRQLAAAEINPEQADRRLLSLATEVLLITAACTVAQSAAIAVVRGPFADERY
jgi:hypothetical protein